MGIIDLNLYSPTHYGELYIQLVLTEAHVQSKVQPPVPSVIAHLRVSYLAWICVGRP